MSDTAPAGAGSTEAASAASAVPTPATETTQQPAAPAATPAPGESVITSDAAPSGDAKPDGGDAGDTPADAPDYSGLNLPEGLAAESPLYSEFKAAAAEHKIAPEAAQALIDKVFPGIYARIAELQSEPVRLATERLAEWSNSVMQDPEIGGAKLAGVKATVASAMAQFGNPDEIKSALNETGAGSNPVLIKWFNRMASALSEGTPVKSGGVPNTRKSGPEVFYDHPNSQPHRDAAQ